MLRHMVVTFLMILLLKAPQTLCQSPADSAAIIQTAADYIEGYYSGDGARMKNSLHPGLAKQQVFPDPASGMLHIGRMNAWQLILGTRMVGDSTSSGTQESNRITLLDANANMATVKIISADFIDYLHLARDGSRWVIVNALWELREELEGTDAGGFGGIILILVLIFLSPIIIWPAVFIIRHIRKRDFFGFISERFPVIAKWILVLTLIVCVCFLFMGKRALYMIGIVMGILLLFCNGLIWRRQIWTWIGRVYYGVMTLLVFAILILMFSFVPLMLP